MTLLSPRRWRNVLGTALAVVGLLLMGWPLFTWAYGAYAQRELEKEFDRETSAGEASLPAPPIVAGKKLESASSIATTEAMRAFPVKPKKTASARRPAIPRIKSVSTVRNVARPLPVALHTVKQGAAFARLRIPRIAMEAIVVEGVKRSDLRRGPGHIPGTALPGESRNCAIAAHRAHWFHRLPEVRVGDPVWVETREALYRYDVYARQTVTPDRGDLLNRGDRAELTLITCDAPTYDAPYRILIYCRLAGVFPRTEMLLR